MTHNKRKCKMASSFEEDFLLLDSILPKLLLPNVRNRSTSVHEINKRRPSDGEYHHLFHQLKAHPDRFRSYTRMNQSTFDYILKKVESKLSKSWCNWHEPVLPEERLVVTLRFLITGASFRALAFTFRMGTTTVAAIVSETVDILWEELQPLHMPIPSRALFKSIADEMWDIWNFPNCIGALDGKHVRIRCPENSGSMFYNYKKFFSIVLQALVDANYRFIVIDVGGYGKQSDGGTFQASSLYKSIISRKMEIPEPATLPDSNDVAPFVFVADEAYPLMHCLLKPYGGQDLSLEEDSFNKRLSRCRKTVECAFGILVSKWRLLDKPIETRAELVDRIIKCVCVLHNAIIDREGMDHNYTEVSCGNSTIVWDRSGRPTNDAKSTRDIFTTYFMNHPLDYTKG